MNSPNQLCSFLPVVFACMPMFVSIDSHPEKCITSPILSSNMPAFVSVCITKKETGNRERGVLKNRHFLQVIGCVREYSLITSNDSASDCSYRPNKFITN